MGLHGADDDQLLKEKCTKWHLAAGFLSVLRADNGDYIDWMMKFPEQPKVMEEGIPLKKRQQESAKRTKAIQKNAEASFKLLSLLKLNSVMNESWKSLDKHIAEDDWKKISEECKPLRAAGQALKQDSFFNNLLSFSNKKDTKANLDGIFGQENAARFFLRMMLIEWKNEGEPNLGTDPCKRFCFVMRRWFDTVLYDSVTGYWVGGADQKLIDGLQTPLDFASLNARVNGENWKALIEEMFDERNITTKDYVRNHKRRDGRVVMGNYDKKVRSVLIYHQVLQGRNRSYVTIPEMKDEDYEFHVDHIVSRKDWEQHLLPEHDNLNTLHDKNWCNSIANLTLLGYDTNTSKGADVPSKFFSEIDAKHTSGPYHAFIKEQLMEFGNIPDDDDIIEEISNCGGIDKLREIRREKFVEVFAADNRKTHLFA